MAGAEDDSLGCLDILLYYVQIFFSARFLFLVVLESTSNLKIELTESGDGCVLCLLDAHHGNIDSNNLRSLYDERARNVLRL